MNGRLMKIWDEYPELLLRVKMYTSMLDQLQKEDFAEELDRVRNDPIMSAEIKAKLAQSIIRRQQMSGFDREMYKKLIQQDGTELAMFESALDALPESLREVAKALASAKKVGIRLPKGTTSAGQPWRTIASVRWQCCPQYTTGMIALRSKNC